MANSPRDPTVTIMGLTVEVLAPSMVVAKHPSAADLVVVAPEKKEEQEETQWAGGRVCT